MLILQNNLLRWVSFCREEPKSARDFMICQSPSEVAFLPTPADFQNGLTYPHRNHMRKATKTFLASTRKQWRWILWKKEKSHKSSLCLLHFGGEEGDGSWNKTGLTQKTGDLVPARDAWGNRVGTWLKYIHIYIYVCMFKYIYTYMFIHVLLKCMKMYIYLCLYC